MTAFGLLKLTETNINFPLKYKVGQDKWGGLVVGKNLVNVT